MTIELAGRYRVKFRAFRRDLFWLPWQHIEYATASPDAVVFGKYNGLPIVRIETDKAKTSANVLFYDVYALGQKVFSGYTKGDYSTTFRRNGVELDLSIKVSDA